MIGKWKNIDDERERIEPIGSNASSRRKAHGPIVYARIKTYD
jgi:hypothetical protein